MVETSDDGGGPGGAIRAVVRNTPDGSTIPEETWRSRHRKILAVLVAHVPLLFLLGLYSGTETLLTMARIPAFSLPSVLLGTGVVLAFGVLGWVPSFPRRARTAFATLGIMSASAVLVYFSGGYIEAHFHFFVMIAVVAIYEDWLPFVIGILYVAVQHGYFGMTSPELVYNHPAAIARPWAWAIVHAGFVLALSVALVSHWLSTERSRQEAAARSQEARTLQERKAEIEAAKAEAEEARAEAEARKQELQAFTDHLERKADAYGAKMAAAADGDLSVRLDPDSRSEAMTAVAESFNEMLDETGAAVAEIQAFTGEVAAASEEASGGVEEVQRASAEVTDSMQEISAGADDQRRMLRKVAGEMNELSASVEEVASSVESVARTSQETADVAADGEAAAEGAIEDARAVRDAIGSTVDRVETLEDRMEDIVEVTDLIGEIARQTNLLALNANIEAARFGGGSGGGGASSDGEGFGVVADEVKQLAEETQESANEIEALIEEIRGQTKETVAEARRADERMEENVEAVQAVLEAFSRVADNTDETHSGIREISAATDDQADSAGEVVAMVDEVSEIGERTAEEAETVSAAAEEQTASLRQVSENVESLADQAERLRTLLAAFDTGELAAEGERPGAAADGGTPE